MGTGPFAVPSFEALRQKGYELVHVVTRPEVPTHKKERPLSPVRQWATDHKLPLSDPASINAEDTVRWLQGQRSDLLVVCDYGQILSRDALASAKLGGINLHGSILPRHRGAAPVQWSILAGDPIAGVSIIHMTPALDGGPVLHTLSTPIGDMENARELESRLSQIGVQSTLESVALLETKQCLDECVNLGGHQDKYLATNAPRLAKEDGELNLHYAVRWIDRLIRGLQPWPGSFAQVAIPDGKTLRLIIPKAIPIEINMALSPFLPGDLLFGERLKQFRETIPGLDTTACRDASLVAVGIDGLLVLPVVQPAGKRLMSSDEFLRGYSRIASMRIICTPGSHRLLNKMSCT